MNIQNFVIDPTQRDMIAALLESDQNVLLTGPTGSGKTTFCYALADSMQMNPVVINLGSTQDARSSLLGSYSLQDGNTSFEESDFLKAVRTPDTLIVLDEVSRASSDAMNILFPLLDGRRSIRVEENNGDTRVIPVADGVRFIATANIGAEYSAARKIDRALIDRFMVFQLPYLNESELVGIMLDSQDFTDEGTKTVVALGKTYAHAAELYKNSKVRTRLSPRTVISAAALANKFSFKQIVENVILPMFSGNGGVANEQTRIREFIDSHNLSSSNDIPF
jgi:MoxR-like ATPase